MGGSFNTREFFHGKSDVWLRHIRWVFVVAVFPLPLALLYAGVKWDSTVLLTAACVCQYLGLLAERWAFFAEANHPQNLYYQALG